MENECIISFGLKGGLGQSTNDPMTAAEISALFDACRASKKITIWLHGGLVNRESGLESAKAMSKIIEDAGNVPISIVWKTGLKETILANISRISSESFYKKALVVLIRKLLQKVGPGLSSARGAGVMPLEDEVKEELSKPRPFVDYPLHVADSAGKSSRNTLLLTYASPLAEGLLESELMPIVITDDEFLRIITETPLFENETNTFSGRGVITAALIVRCLAKIALRAIRRFASERDHGFYPTIVEEILREFYIANIGAWVWKAMKDKAKDMWIGENSGQYFLQGLLKHWSEFPETSFNLIGHSAGSIAICHFLEQAAIMGNCQKFNSILFLAPACKTELFDQAICSHPDRFSTLRIFTMTDENERNDVLAPHFYTRSLLYLVSGILEDEGKAEDATILGLERHISNSAPYNSDARLAQIHKSLYEPNSHRIVYSQTADDAPAGLRTKALSHGDFDTDSNTLESLKFIIG